MKAFPSRLAVVFLITAVTSQAADVVIHQKNNKFEPGTVSAKLGDTLVFVNDEKNETHNVYSMSKDNNVESQMQKPGEKMVVALDPSKHKVGTMEIKCAVHPGMTLKVNIIK